MDFQDFSRTLNQISMTKDEQFKMFCVLKAYAGLHFERLSLKNILIISNSAYQIGFVIVTQRPDVCGEM